MNSVIERPLTLVVGADSVIGGALLESLQNSGLPAIGTTRRRDTVNETRQYLDLSEKAITWEHPRPVATAVLCAGVTRLNDCQTDPEGSRWINVDAICALATDLSAQGAFVVFLSTSHVFDGLTAYASIDDPVSPVTEYGRQKAEAERRISELDGPSAILRLTKVLAPKNELFESWVKTMRSGQPIHPFKDTYLAPVPLFTVVSVLKLIVGRQLSGILQVSGERDISYADSAMVAARLLEVDPALVQPVESSLSGKVVDQSPAHTTLDVSRLKTTLSVDPPPTSWTIEAAFSNTQLLAEGDPVTPVGNSTGLN